MEPTTCLHRETRYHEDDDTLLHVCMECGQALPLHGLPNDAVVLATATTDTELLDPVED